MADKRCDLRFYKSFLPRRRPSALTAKQQEQLNTLTEAQANKYISMLSDMGDDSFDAMNIAMAISPRRVSQFSDLGTPTAKMVQDAEAAAAKALADVPEAQRLGAQEVGERLLLNYKKGEVLDPVARALASKAFANVYANMPLLTKSLKHALETKNERAATALLNQWVDSLAITAGYVGDGNAWSKAGNMRKYYKQQIKRDADIAQLFQDGKC